jgi:hypothetical protein
MCLENRAEKHSQQLKIFAPPLLVYARQNVECALSLKLNLEKKGSDSYDDNA